MLDRTCPLLLCLTCSLILRSYTFVPLSAASVANVSYLLTGIVYIAASLQLQTLICMAELGVLCSTSLYKHFPDLITFVIIYMSVSKVCCVSTVNSEHVYELSKEKSLNMRLRRSYKCTAASSWLLCVALALYFITLFISIRALFYLMVPPVRSLTNLNCESQVLNIFAFVILRSSIVSCSIVANRAIIDPSLYMCRMTLVPKEFNSLVFIVRTAYKSEGASGVSRSSYDKVVYKGAANVHTNSLVLSLNPAHIHPSTSRVLLTRCHFCPLAAQYCKRQALLSNGEKRLRLLTLLLLYCLVLRCIVKTYRHYYRVVALLVFYLAAYLQVSTLALISRVSESLLRCDILSVNKFFSRSLHLMCSRIYDLVFCFIFILVYYSIRSYYSYKKRRLKCDWNASCISKHIKIIFAIEEINEYFV